MDIGLAELLIIFVATLGSGTMVALIAYFLNRLRRLESGGSANSGRLEDQVHRLREELISVQEELTSLGERVDFSENLLMNGEESTPDDTVESP